MLTLNNSCFFCGTIVSQNDPRGDEDTTDSIDSFDNNNIPTKEAAKKCILQISHYLKVPKSEISQQLGDVDDVPLINICQPCWKISEKLSNLCGELEVIQMKIKYFLNLLSDQIFIDDKPKGPTHQSTFQQTFVQKCVSKLASSKANPELRLAKCEPSEQQEIFKDLDDDQDDNDHFGDNSESRATDIFDILSKKSKSSEKFPTFRCNYCPIVISSEIILKKHVIAVHLNKMKKTSSGHKIKSCEYCGAMMPTSSLGRHRRNVHGMPGKRVAAAKLNDRKMKRCKICGKLIPMKSVNLHEKICGLSDQVKIEQVDEEEIATPSNKLEVRKRKYFQGSGTNLKLANSLIRWKCKSCGKRFLNRSRLTRHTRQSAGCAGPGNWNRIEFKDRFECSSCHRRFSRMSYLSKHLTKICKTGGVIDYGDVGRKEEVQDISNKLNDDHDDDNADFGENSEPTPPTTDKIDTLPEQLKSSKNIPQFKCNYCPIIISNEIILKRHVIAVHLNKMKKTSSGHKIRSCEYCGAMMPTSSLGRHRRNVHGMPGKRVAAAKLNDRKMKRCKFCRKLISVKSVNVHERLCGEVGRKGGMAATCGEYNNVSIACEEGYPNETEDFQVEEMADQSINLEEVVPEHEIKVEDGQTNQTTGMTTEDCLQDDDGISSPQISTEDCPISILPNNVAEESTNIDIKFETNSVNSCPFCNFCVTGPYKLVHSHIEANHPEKLQTEPVEDTKLPCLHCGLLFPTNELKSHKGKCRKEKKRKLRICSKAIKCTRCGVVYANNSTLTRHLRQSATCGFDVDRKNAEFKDRFECSNCHMRFSRTEQVRIHFRKYCKTGAVIDHGADEGRKVSEQADGVANMLGSQGEFSGNNNEGIFTDEDPLQI